MTPEVRKLVNAIEAEIREFKGEIRDNNKDIKSAIRLHDFGDAAHLESVNGALQYVIERLENIVDDPD